MRTAMISVLFLAFSAGDTLAGEVERQIRELEAERNALLAELAEAKLKIASLQDRLDKQTQQPQATNGNTPGAHVPQGAAVVLIPRFESTSYGSYVYSSGDLAETGRNVLEDLLINKKMTVIERQRVDQALKAARGEDDATALKAGKSLGATVLITGTILSAGRETKKGVGDRPDTTTLTIEIRLRVINIESGQVVHSVVYNGRVPVDTRGTGVKQGSSYDLVKSALVQVNKPFLDVVNSQKGRTAGGAVLPPPTVASNLPLIEMTFTPTPRECEVLIDGQYVGVTPYTAKLPVGKSVRVLFRKTGYRTWESTLTPSSSLTRLSPELPKQ